MNHLKKNKHIWSRLQIPLFKQYPAARIFNTDEALINVHHIIGHYTCTRPRATCQVRISGNYCLKGFPGVRI